jgi:purine-nucleoside phosphorylase
MSAASPSLSLTMSQSYDQARVAADWLCERLGHRAPQVAMILGSGLGDLTALLGDPLKVAYSEIPYLPRPGVAGHAGTLWRGVLAGVDTLIFQGRFHHYEGHDLATVTLPVRIVRCLEIPTLILTAAVGGIRDDLRPGALVLLHDHLNLLGENPLRGPNDERHGPRFPDLSAVYSVRLRQLVRASADELGLTVTEGVYACFPGPSYETPAEVRMARALGADVVGMSTVPEAIVAGHAGLDVLAIAVVTNAAAGLGEPLNHDDVLEESRKAVAHLGRLLVHSLPRLASPPDNPA